jgi:hypothetical protein
MAAIALLAGGIFREPHLATSSTRAVAPSQLWPPAFKMCSNKALRLRSNWRTYDRGRRSTRAQKHSKTESKAAKRTHRKRSSPQLKSTRAHQQKAMGVLAAGLKAQAVNDQFSYFTSQREIPYEIKHNFDKKMAILSEGFAEN